MKTVKAATHNRKQAIVQYMRQFQHRFYMDADCIDLRDMSKNYGDGPIPVQEVHKAITTVLGLGLDQITPNVDPSGGSYLGYGPGARPKEYFDYVHWDQIYLWTIFQRDVSPNHVHKIYRDFDSSAVIVPCLIKITMISGDVIYCVWDGHHTIQTCRLQGWSKFPAWVIDVDQFSAQQIQDAGFGTSDQDRIQFACWVAGRNMRRINGLNKLALNPYDDFMIGLQTNDAKCVAMNNILLSHSCMPRRHSSGPGAWSQIKSGIECYDLESVQGPSNGLFWSRALALHRKHWSALPLTLEVYRPFSYLFREANVQGFQLPSTFDDELAGMLKKRWGDTESIQSGIKDSYWTAVHNNSLVGDQPQHDKFRVLAGLINFYRQQGGKFLLPAPSCQWAV